MSSILLKNHFGIAEKANFKIYIRKLTVFKGEEKCGTYLLHRTDISVNKYNSRMEISLDIKIKISTPNIRRI